MQRGDCQMKKHIVVLKGDGIGPEIVNEAIKVLKRIAEKYNHEFEIEELLFGGASIDEYGVPLTDETLTKCKNSDAVLLGAVGGPKWDNVEKENRPESGLLRIRKGLELFANLRPTKLYKELIDSCPLKKEIIKDGIDFVMIRELTGGVYFGKKETKSIDGVTVATDEMKYDENEIRRIGKIAFETAMKRNKKLASIDKSNVLDTSKLWRKIMHELSAEYKEVLYEDMLVDSASMQLIKNPSRFDVVVTENMFGDILSDEASVLAGSIGMMPSASLGATKLGLYEPIHGSAPDIAGQNISNPIGTILSVAMLLRYSFDMESEARDVENAVERVLSEGCRTVDIYIDGMKKLSCSEMGDKIVSYL